MPDDLISSPPRRPLGRAGKAVLGVLGTAAAGALVFAALTGGDDPPVPPPAPPATSPAGTGKPVAGPIRSLRGAPVAGRTGMRVLVAANPPVVVDIDDGARIPIRGLPAGGERLHYVRQLGANEAIIGSERTCADCGPDADLYVIGGQDYAARKIGAGRWPVPSRDGRSVWVMHDGERGRCRLDRITVHGGEPSKRDLATLDCRIRLVRDTPRGLVLDGPAEGPDDTMLLDSDATSRAELRGPVAYAGGAWVQFDTFGRRVLLRGGMIEWSWPSALEAPEDLVPDYGDRNLFAEFAAPEGAEATGRARDPVLDLWMLDSVEPRWIRTPRMPLAAYIKNTSAAWTVDNRLVMVGSFPGVGEAVAIWSRGRPDWEVRHVDLPDDRSSDTFAILEPRP